MLLTAVAAAVVAAVATVVAVMMVAAVAASGLVSLEVQAAKKRLPMCLLAGVPQKWPHRQSRRHH